MTLIILNPMEEKDLEKAVKILKTGGIVAYPTDTAYALGVDALNTSAVLRLSVIKKRPKGKRFTITVDSVESAGKYAVLSDLERGMLEAFAPGPFTFIFHKREVIPSVVNPIAIGIRIPDRYEALELARRLDRPITATSANISGAPPSYSVKEVIYYFNGLINAIIDGGDLKRGRMSTIVDFTSGKPVLVRRGVIPFEEIVRKYEELSMRLI